MILVYGEDIGLLEEKISEITNKNYISLIFDNNYDDIFLKFSNKSIFDFDESSIPAATYVIRDFNNFLSSSKNVNSKKFLDLLDFLKTKKDKIIFLTNAKQIPKIYSKYFDFINVKKLNKLTIKNYCIKLIRKFNIKINKENFLYLTENLQSDSLLINREIEKLALLNKVVTKEIIDNFVCVDISKNVFELIDNFFSKNYEKIVNQINLFEISKIDFLEIFNVLVSQLFSIKLYRLNYLKNKNYSKICEDFSVQMFQIEKIKKLILNLDILEIDIFLNNLLKLNILYLSKNKQLSMYLKVILLNGGEYGL